MGETDLEIEVEFLKQQVAELAAQIAALGAPAGGVFIIDTAPGQIVDEPKPVTAFDVRMIDGAWKMYYPDGCLICDGVAPTGITPDADGYVAVTGGDVGIGVTWTKDKTTKAVSDVVATINQNLSSSLTVTEEGDSYKIEANFPVALKINNEIRQVTSGFVSLASDTSDSSKNVFVDNVSIEEYDDSTSDSGSEAEPVHAIKGWHTSEASESKLGDLLTGDEEDTSRQILVRNGKGGAIEFLQIGKVKKPSGTVKFIGDDGIRYDVSTKQIQIRVDSIDLKTLEVTKGDWKMITGGQAVPHSTVE